jgi:hypothetical protein
VQVIADEVYSSLSIVCRLSNVWTCVVYCNLYKISNFIKLPANYDLCNFAVTCVTVAVFTDECHQFTFAILVPIAKPSLSP